MKLSFIFILIVASFYCSAQTPAISKFTLYNYDTSVIQRRHDILQINVMKISGTIQGSILVQSWNWDKKKYDIIAQYPLSDVVHQFFLFPMFYERVMVITNCTCSVKLKIYFKSW